jgi:hypothetical protein
MTPEDKQRIKDAFNASVERMPTDKLDSVFYSKDGVDYTPRQFAAEVQSETGAGKDWLDSQEFCVDKGFTTVRRIIAKLGGPAS